MFGHRTSLLLKSIHRLNYDIDIERGMMAYIHLDELGLNDMFVYSYNSGQKLDGRKLGIIAEPKKEEQEMGSAHRKAT
jgi:hypothetical protein